MRTTSIALPLALAAAVAGAACSSPSEASSEQRAQPATAVPLVAAQLATVPDYLTITGTVIADESSDVVPDTSGKVIAVLVERGQRVKAGDALVKLDTRTAALGAREATANLEALRAQRQLAEDECKRSQALFEKGAISKSQFEREQASCTSARQQVAAAEARTQMVTKSIADGVLRAPFAGVVNDVWVSPGEWAAPGMRLVTLVDDDPLTVELQVPESAAARIKDGQAVEIEAVAFPGKTFPATVTRTGAEVGRMTRSLVAEAEIAPGSGLRPGMFAEVRVAVGERKLPVVPKAAVQKRGSTWRIWAVVKGALEERVIQLGPEVGGDRVAVQRGLAEGEKVASPVTEQIVDGLRVE